MDNGQLIRNFYTAFANRDAEAMSDCYHPEVIFHDPAFGTLNGKQASDMWKMLIVRSKGQLKIDFSDVFASGDSGSANWTAEYIFSKTRRKVLNRIHAEFKFKDGLIVNHKDDFDFWKWSRQALGLPGLLFGWTPFLQNKVRKQARISLDRWQRKQL